MFRIICRSFVSAKVPTHLEPSDVFRSDGETPDGITLVPRESGSCSSGIPHAVTHFYLPTIAPSGTRAVASEAERHKQLKYSHLPKSSL